MNPVITTRFEKITNHNMTLSYSPYLIRFFDMNFSKINKNLSIFLILFAHTLIFFLILSMLRNLIECISFPLLSIIFSVILNVESLKHKDLFIYSNAPECVKNFISLNKNKVLSLFKCNSRIKFFSKVFLFGFN